MSEVQRSDLSFGATDGPDYLSNVVPSDLTFGTDEPEDASLDPFAGGTANNRPIWSADQIASYLNRTSGQWGTGFNDMLPRGGDSMTITYGFHNDQQSLFDNGYVYASGGGLYGLAEFFNFAPFNEAQREATREAIQYWDDLIAPTFVETDSYHADLNYADLASAPGTQAYSRIPTTSLATTLGGQVAGIAGDVWVSASQASNFQLQVGGYGLNTLVHETGHSLGLSHPGAYNFGPGFSVTYGNGAEYAQDARNYTIMSYWNPRDMGSTATGVPTRDYNWSLMQIAYGSTPMIHDILAVQHMYGADLTTRTGDTTYGFNSNAGRDAFDFTVNNWPTMTIYDAGGNDTLDASGYAVTQVIDLTPGSLSSIGGMTWEQAQANLSFAQVNANRAALGLPPVTLDFYNANMAGFAADPEWRGRLTDNVGIAYGTIIENAVGGSGNDTIIGNEADNRLVGNAGNDTITGGIGNDTLIGDAGTDSLDGGIGTDTVSYAGATGGVTVDLGAGTASGADGNDTLAAIENVVGSGFNDLLAGTSGANVLEGGAGTDTVSYSSATGAVSVNLADGMASGAGGNDTLVSIEDAIGSSFNDTFLGTSGANVFDGGAGSDTVSYANAGGAVSVDLGAGTVTGAAGNDSLVSIENAVGSGFNDSFVGTSGANTLNGGLGTDSVSYSNATGSVNINLGAGTASGGAGNDSLISIESAVGSSYNDRIIGDAGANRIAGGSGVDVITLGAGNDVFVAEVTVKSVTKAGTFSWDVITDFNGDGDLIDLTGLGSAFHFDGTSANKDAGDVTFKVYTSITGAENALGIDIHSLGGANVSGPVTVVYGNLDGNSPDFALVLLNTSSVDVHDFIWP